MLLLKRKMLDNQWKIVNICHIKTSYPSDRLRSINYFNEHFTSGYSGDGTTCVDIDECDENKPTHNCATTATCMDTDGSFDCECNPGFSGNGVTCDGKKSII